PQLGTVFGTVFAHETIHFLQKAYGIGRSTFDSSWKAETIPNAVEFYLRAIAEGGTLEQVCRQVTAIPYKAKFLEAFRYGFDHPDDPITADIVRKVVPSEMNDRMGYGFGTAAGALIGGAAYRRYLDTGRWEEGRDVIRRYILPSRLTSDKSIESPGTAPSFDRTKQSRT